MTPPAPPEARPLHALAAFGTGCLLTLMLLFNSEVGRHGGAFHASWVAHGTGTVAAAAVLLLLGLRSRRNPFPLRGRPPFWAWLGGCTGAVNVMLSSTAVNTGLALSGTQAVALAAQMLFSLAADALGLLGLARRGLGWRDLLPVLLIVAGSAVIILFGSAPR